MIIQREIWNKFVNHPRSKVYGTDMKEEDRLQYNYGLETKLFNQHEKCWEETKDAMVRICHG